MLKVDMDVEEILKTYIKPVRNTAVTPIFFVNDICSRYKIGNGKMKM